MSDDADAPRERPEPQRGEREREEVPDRLAETIRQKLEQLVPDLVKKTFAAGMGAVFTTEEGIRRVVGGARESLPEVAGYLASPPMARRTRSSRSSRARPASSCRT
jgi:hypothetical protein